MDKAYKIMLYVGWGLSLILVVLWPLLALPAGVFSKSYFTFWVILAITWGFAATVISECWPALAACCGLLAAVARPKGCKGWPRGGTCCARLQCDVLICS
jgi:hypothetical protein